MEDSTEGSDVSNLNNRLASADDERAPLVANLLRTDQR